jgi:hypothetical protein
MYPYYNNNIIKKEKKLTLTPFKKIKCKPSLVICLQKIEDGKINEKSIIDLMLDRRKELLSNLVNGLLTTVRQPPGTKMVDGE